MSYLFCDSSAHHVLAQTATTEIAMILNGDTTILGHLELDDPTTADHDIADALRQLAAAFDRDPAVSPDAARWQPPAAGIHHAT